MTVQPFTQIVQTIVRMPTSPEFERLAFYGRRVRRLDILAEELNLLGEELVGNLVLSNRENMLLPDLRHLWYRGIADASLSHLHAFIQPQLRGISLCVNISAHTQMLMDVLDNLWDRCPELQELTLDQYLVDPPASPGDDEHADQPPCALFIERWCTYALSLKDLTEFSISGHAVSFAVLEYLASSPRLKRFSAFENRLDSLADLASTGMALFPVLRSISAGFGDPERLSSVLGNITSTSIDFFYIIALDCAPCRAITLFGILQTIAASWTTLSTLSLWFLKRLERRLVTHVEDDYIVTLNTLRPVLQLRLLTHVTITAGAVAVDDEMLVAMADSWPGLQALELSCEHQPVRQILEGASAVTLQGIEALVARCPDLARLKIMLDTASARTWVSNGNLKHIELNHLASSAPEISFQHSKVMSADVGTLAAALARIFPAPWRLTVDFMMGYGHMLDEEVQQDGLEEHTFFAELMNREQHWNQVAARMKELQRTG
jgi:hypothetical protein